MLRAARRRPRSRSAPDAPPAPTARRVRVLFLNGATQPPLGADLWVHAQILTHLDRSRFELHAACDPGRPGRSTPSAEALGAIADLELLPIHLGAERRQRGVVGLVLWMLGSLQALAGLARLTRYVRRHRIDIIQSADRPRDALVCVLVGRLTKARSIVHVHVAYGEWMSPLLKWALRHADALVGVSVFVAGTLVASGHAADRVNTVRNGIDVDAWTPWRGRHEARAELGVDGDVPVVLTICRLFREKGPSALIEALELVSQHHPDVRLLIAGQEMVPGYAEELRQLAEQLDLAANVALLGRRSDVEGLLAACDVFAMPSLAEPFGLVFVEAMAMEVPVVALASGGATEVVVHGVTGLLSERGDRAGLAKHLLELVDDPSRRAAMGQAGRRRAEACFTSERMATDMGAVYETLVPVASPAG